MLHSLNESCRQNVPDRRELLAPVDWELLADTSQPFKRLYQWRNADKAARQAISLGESALKNGQVGVVLLAGGMATRLEQQFPKGMYPIGFRGESLFELFADKLKRIKSTYGKSVPWFIMTSDSTDVQTRLFFREKNNFGLESEDVIFFKQGNMPACDLITGEILYTSPECPAVSPDGHGGVLDALKKNDLFSLCKRRGIELLCSFQVDNPLIPLADPEFIGYCLYDKADMATLVIPKNSPIEKVGNMVLHGDTVQVIEYSDLPERCARRTLPNGELALNWGNIAIHVFRVDFLDAIMNNPDFALPYHTVNKIVPFIDKSGNLIRPTQPNAQKKERFLFDIFPRARRLAVVVGKREECFAALKNAPGSETDNAETVRAAMRTYSIAHPGEFGAVDSDAL